MSGLEIAPNPIHLLLVDDDMLVLVTLENALKRVGYRVTSVESTRDALAVLESGVRPDLAIVDVQLPDADGLELVTQLDRFDRIPFLMLSAHSDATKYKRAASLGSLGYMVKPQTIHQLVPVIESALERAREIRRLSVEKNRLKVALESEQDVNVAVGITMVQRGLTRTQAFNALRDLSRAQRCKVADVSAKIVESVHVSPYSP